MNGGRFLIIDCIFLSGDLQIHIWVLLELLDVCHLDVVICQFLICLSVLGLLLAPEKWCIKSCRIIWMLATSASSYIVTNWSSQSHIWCRTTRTSVSAPVGQKVCVDVQLVVGALTPAPAPWLGCRKQQSIQLPLTDQVEDTLTLDRAVWRGLREASCLSCDTTHGHIEPTAIPSLK